MTAENHFADMMRLVQRPTLGEQGTHNIWTDQYISTQMLEAHLNPAIDAATRRIEVVDASVDWIASSLPPADYPDLIDLGCGPGVYAERFAARGYRVTGIDFSDRSIAHARATCEASGSRITYRWQSYLELDDEAGFDLATLIYCDYGVLPADDRRRLLANVHRALRPGGVLLLDGFTPAQYDGVQEDRRWEASEGGGFWTDQPHLCLHATHRYDDESAMLRQVVVLTSSEVRQYSIWEHLFTPERLSHELTGARFTDLRLFADVTGTPMSEGSTTICVVATRSDGMA